MAEIINFLKAHKSQIIQYGKKAFAWWKKRQSQQQQQGAGAGAGQAQYHQQQQQQQQQQYPQQDGYAGAASQGAWQQQQPSNGHGQGPPSGNYDQPPQQYSAPPRPPQQGHIGPHHKYDDNRVNQTNERYQSLRSQAHQEGDAMAKAFDASHRAYSNGDGAGAKQLSNEGHQHKARMEQLNREAADWIFKANNEDSPDGTVDLHGLYTSEAIDRTEHAVRDAQGRGLDTLRVIVGKGIHSKDHVQHIRPAVEKLMRQYNLAAHIDPQNAGVLIVSLRGGGGARGMPETGDTGFTRDLAKHATGDEENCSIM